MTLLQMTALVLAGLVPQPAEARETAFVRFICSSAGAVVDVVTRSDDLVHGISPLPAGCRWLAFRTTGTIGETVSHIDTPGRKIARISIVTIGPETGYSSGLVELLL